jgi:hypothetical protein
VSGVDSASFVTIARINSPTNFITKLISCVTQDTNIQDDTGTYLPKLRLARTLNNRAKPKNGEV